VNFQGNAHIISKRANKDHPASERDANKAWRAIEGNSVTKRDANKERRANNAPTRTIVMLK
jgi:hypothetical protein